MWKKSRSSAKPNNLSKGIVRLARCLFLRAYPARQPHTFPVETDRERSTLHGTEDLSGYAATGRHELHRQGRTSAGNRDPDFRLSSAGVQAGQMLCKTGGAAKAAAARAAYIGRLSALHCVLSGRGRGRALPDRAEAAVYKAAGGAGIFLHQLDGHGRRADRIPQLPGGKPAPHRGARSLWSCGYYPYTG